MYFELFTHFPHNIFTSSYFQSLTWPQHLYWSLLAAERVIWASCFDILRKVCKERKTHEQGQKGQGSSVNSLSHFCKISREPSHFWLGASSDLPMRPSVQGTLLSEKALQSSESQFVGCAQAQGHGHRLSEMLCSAGIIKVLIYIGIAYFCATFTC